MTFLPKAAEARRELINLAVALPLALLATAFLFALDFGVRIAV